VKPLGNLLKTSVTCTNKHKRYAISPIFIVSG